jgi:HNH endonuclease
MSNSRDNRDIPISRAKELFKIVNGLLYWRINKGKMKAGSPAGHIWTTRPDGKQYRIATIDKIQYYAHRIIWVVKKNSQVPIGTEIDHKNGNSLDNRPKNLRAVSTQTNIENKRTARKNSKIWSFRRISTYF